MIAVDFFVVRKACVIWVSVGMSSGSGIVGGPCVRCLCMVSLACCCGVVMMPDSRLVKCWKSVT